VGDAHQLQQVFLNILNTAYECTHFAPGHRDPTPRTVHIEVVFTDNGPGIAKDRIFDPLHHQGSGQGHGLGLSICYGIVREHGGEIAPEPRDQPGASFSGARRCLVAMVAAAEVEDDFRRPATGPRPAPLVIEDEPGDDPAALGPGALGLRHAAAPSVRAAPLAAGDYLGVITDMHARASPAPTSTPDRHPPPPLASASCSSPATANEETVSLLQRTGAPCVENPGRATVVASGRPSQGPMSDDFRIQPGGTTSRARKLCSTIGASWASLATRWRAGRRLAYLGRIARPCPRRPQDGEHD
jgi:hypothetical protein